MCVWGGERIDGRMDGCMGVASAWLQSRFLIGCRPGNGTSDLIYPPFLTQPFAHPALARALLPL